VVIAIIFSFLKSQSACL